MPAWVRGAVGAAGLLTVVGTTALLALDSAKGTNRFVDDGHAVPHALLGPLAGLGNTLYQPRFYALLIVMSVGYAAVVWANALSGKVVAAGIVVANLIAFIGPPITSDVFSYLDYARMGALHGVNPYIHGPASVHHDLAFPYVGSMWKHTASAYGPLWTVASYPAAFLGLLGGVWFLKGIAFVSCLAIVALTAACAKRYGRDPLRAALLVGANPLMIVFGVQGGHNDLPMLALMMLGVFFGLRGLEGRGAASVVIGAAIKAPAIVVLPFMLLQSRERRRVVVGAAIAAAAVALIGLVAFGTHAAGFIGVVSRQQRLLDQNSFAQEVAHLFGAQQVSAGGRLVLQGLLACLIVYLLVRVWRGADWVAGAGWALLASAVVTTWLLAWYTIWALPLAAVSRDRRLLIATLFIEAVYLYHRLPTPLQVGF
ncbi:MAG: alpha,6-mannosyltransferase [Thermoleophilaceae bacterium]|jgi:hypothetical protein|nr:alpha,6-mannosyltransferase [Thermoleophilaceae bacterium]